MRRNEPELRDPDHQDTVACHSQLSTSKLKNRIFSVGAGGYRSRQHYESCLACSADGTASPGCAVGLVMPCEVPLPYRSSGSLAASSPDAHQMAGYLTGRIAPAGGAACLVLLWLRCSGCGLTCNVVNGGNENRRFLLSDGRATSSGRFWRSGMARGHYHGGGALGLCWPTARKQEDCPSLRFDLDPGDRQHTDTRARAIERDAGHGARDMLAPDCFSRQPRAWPMVMDHSRGLHSSAPNSRARPAAMPGSSTRSCGRGMVPAR